MDPPPDYETAATTQASTPADCCYCCCTDVVPLQMLLLLVVLLLVKDAVTRSQLHMVVLSVLACCPAALPIATTLSQQHLLSSLPSHCHAAHTANAMLMHSVKTGGV
jgi:hypothetical protein